jgi:molybdenum cofactor biosynthesis enzyme MoaA
VNNIFDCKAIDHSVTFYTNNKITPCCIIHDYAKDIATVSDSTRFADLKVPGVPGSCQHCVGAGEHSYKHRFDRFHDGFKQIDVRNSNICNLKCRTCGPAFSSKWADELGVKNPVMTSDINSYIDQILNSSVKFMYFAGGEPLLNPDHWALLDRIIEKNLASDMGLQYSTNCTTIKYKNKDIFEYWRQFQNVTVLASIDATGKAFEYIRSDARWDIVDRNLRKFIDQRSYNLDVKINFVLSALSVWFLPDVLRYAQTLGVNVNIFQLTDPEYYALNALPDTLVERCVSVLAECVSISPEHMSIMNHAMASVKENSKSYLFEKMVSQVLLLDRYRNENLFDLLPFKDVSLSEIM